MSQAFLATPTTPGAGWPFNQLPLTLPGTTTAGAAAPGLLALSSDSCYVSLLGCNAPAGSVLPASSLVVGSVAGDGLLRSTIAVSMPTAAQPSAALVFPGGAALHGAGAAAPLKALVSYAFANASVLEGGVAVVNGIVSTSDSIVGNGTNATAFFPPTWPAPPYGAVAVGGASLVIGGVTFVVVGGGDGSLWYKPMAAAPTVQPTCLVTSSGACARVCSGSIVGSGALQQFVFAPAPDGASLALYAACSASFSVSSTQYPVPVAVWTSPVLNLGGAWSEVSGRMPELIVPVGTAPLLAYGLVRTVSGGGLLVSTNVGLLSCPFNEGAPSVWYFIYTSGTVACTFVSTPPAGSEFRGLAPAPSTLGACALVLMTPTQTSSVSRSPSSVPTRSAGPSVCASASASTSLSPSRTASSSVCGTASVPATLSVSRSSSSSTLPSATMSTSGLSSVSGTFSATATLSPSSLRSRSVSPCASSSATVSACSTTSQSNSASGSSSATPSSGMSASGCASESSALSATPFRYTLSAAASQSMTASPTAMATGTFVYTAASPIRSGSGSPTGSAPWATASPTACTTASGAPSASVSSASPSPSAQASDTSGATLSAPPSPSVSASGSETVSPSASSAASASGALGTSTVSPSTVASAASSGSPMASPSPVATVSRLQSVFSTVTPTVASALQSPTVTPTATASITALASLSSCASVSPTATELASRTPSHSASSAATASGCASASASPSTPGTSSACASLSAFATRTSAQTGSATVSATASPIATLTVGTSPLKTPTAVQTASAAATASPGASPSSTVTASGRTTATASVSGCSSASSTATGTSSCCASASRSARTSLSATASVSASASARFTRSPSASPSTTASSRGSHSATSSTSSSALPPGSPPLTSTHTARSTSTATRSRYPTSPATALLSLTLPWCGAALLGSTPLGLTLRVTVAAAAGADPNTVVLTGGTCLGAGGENAVYSAGSGPNIAVARRAQGSGGTLTLNAPMSVAFSLANVASQYASAAGVASGTVPAPVVPPWFADAQPRRASPDVLAARFLALEVGTALGCDASNTGGPANKSDASRAGALFFAAFEAVSVAQGLPPSPAVVCFVGLETVVMVPSPSSTPAPSVVVPFAGGGLQGAALAGLIVGVSVAGIFVIAGLVTLAMWARNRNRSEKPLTAVVIEGPAAASAAATRRSSLAGGSTVLSSSDADSNRDGGAWTGGASSLGGASNGSSHHLRRSGGVRVDRSWSRSHRRGDSGTPHPRRGSSDGGRRERSGERIGSPDREAPWGAEGGYGGSSFGGPGNGGSAYIGRPGGFVGGVDLGARFAHNNPLRASGSAYNVGPRTSADAGYYYGGGPPSEYPESVSTERPPSYV